MIAKNFLWAIFAENNDYGETEEIFIGYAEFNELFQMFQNIKKTKERLFEKYQL